MISNQQITYRLTQQGHIEHLDTDELALLRNRRQIKRLMIKQALTARILNTITVASIASAGLFGIGALGCWGLEVIEPNAKPIFLHKQQDWQIRKNICLGWMLVAFSSFLGSASLGEKSPSASNERT